MERVSILSVVNILFCQQMSLACMHTRCLVLLVVTCSGTCVVAASIYGHVGNVNKQEK